MNIKKHLGNEEDFSKQVGGVQIELKGEQILALHLPDDEKHDLKRRGMLLHNCCMCSSNEIRSS